MGLSFVRNSLLCYHWKWLSHQHTCKSVERLNGEEEEGKGGRLCSEQQNFNIRESRNRGSPTTVRLTKDHFITNMAKGCLTHPTFVNGQIRNLICPKQPISQIENQSHPESSLTYPDVIVLLAIICNPASCRDNLRFPLDPNASWHVLLQVLIQRPFGGRLWGDKICHSLVLRGRGGRQVDKQVLVHLVGISVECVIAWGLHSSNRAKFTWAAFTGSESQVFEAGAALFKNSAAPALD